MEKPGKRLLSVSLSVAMVATTLSILSIIKPKTSQCAVKPCELSPKELASKSLKPEEVPIGIEYDEAVKAGHKVRLYDQEPNDYTVIFQNADNTRTMYYYNVPAKFTDKDGVARDVDNSIVKASDEKYKYTNKLSNTKINFPKDINDGVAINGLSKVNVYPEIANTGKETSKYAGPVPVKGGLITAAVSQLLSLSSGATDETEPQATDEYVDYKNAFGENTTLRYTPLLNGVKQDVILDKKVDINEFSFVFDFGNNKEIMDMDDGGLHVYDTEAKTYTGYIHPISVYDANGSKAENCSYTYEPTADGKWRITAVVDNDFLNSENTVYPVVVDPDYTDIGKYGIKDATVYKSSPKKKEGDLDVLYIGNRDGMGVTRVLMGFYSLDLTAIDESQIYSAYFSLRDLMCYSTEVDVQAYEFNSYWAENDVTWDSCKMSSSSSYASSPFATRTISYAEGIEQTHEHRYYFNIKSIAKRWCSVDAYPSYGFMLKSSSESSKKCVYAGSYQASSYKPTLVLRYTAPTKTVENGTYYFKNPQSKQYMTYKNSDDNNVYQSSFTGNDYQRFNVEYKDNGYYEIHTEQNNDRNLKVENQAGTSDNVRTATRTGSEYQRYRIVKCKYGYRLVSEKYPTQTVQIAEGATGTSNVFLAPYLRKYYQNWYMEKVTPTISISPTSASLVVGQTKTLTKTVKPSTVSKAATFKSSNTSVATVDSNGKITAKSAGTATITATLTALSSSTATCKVTVLNKPDLSVTALTNSSNILNQPVTVSATVKNINSTAGASTLKIDIKNSGGTVVKTQNLSVASLAANASKTVTLSWTPTDEGDYTVTATADSANAVSEQNESNNQKTISFHVYDGANEPENNDISGAEQLTFSESTQDSGIYGAKATSVNSNKNFHSANDLDCYQINAPEGTVLTEMAVPEGAQVDFLDKDGNILCSAESGMLKSTKAVKYIKLSNRAKDHYYSFAVTLITER